MFWSSTLIPSALKKYQAFYQFIFLVLIQYIIYSLVRSVLIACNNHHHNLSETKSRNKKIGTKSKLSWKYQEGHEDVHFLCTILWKNTLSLSTSISLSFCVAISHHFFFPPRALDARDENGSSINKDKFFFPSKKEAKWLKTPLRFFFILSCQYIKFTEEYVESRIISVNCEDDDGCFKQYGMKWYVKANNDYDLITSRKFQQLNASELPFTLINFWIRIDQFWHDDKEKKTWLDCNLKKKYVYYLVKVKGE